MYLLNEEQLIILKDNANTNRVENGCFLIFSTKAGYTPPNFHIRENNVQI